MTKPAGEPAFTSLDPAALCGVTGARSEIAYRRCRDYVRTVPVDAGAAPVDIVTCEKLRPLDVGSLK